MSELNSVNDVFRVHLSVYIEGKFGLFNERTNIDARVLSNCKVTDQIILGFFVANCSNSGLL